ncbi:flagellin [Devosia honganensis]|uniref:Flagellin n=1 Tax=Devosia honganensis TaxID=1610527 RepID=A0ABV7WXK8_9HYPH
MGDISLSKAVRSNLLSLQNTAQLMAQTQNRLATGNKVNSALDNPTNFFTASSLNSRAGDLNQLMDSMANGIQTLEAADNGLSAITKTLESMQSTLRQARQDKSFQTESYTIADNASGNISFSGGAIGDDPLTISMNTEAVDATPATYSGAAVDLSTDVDWAAHEGETISVNGEVVYTFTDATTGQKAALQAALETATGGTVTIDGDGIAIEVEDGTNFSIQSSNAAAATATGISATETTTDDGVLAVPAGVKSVDDLVKEINDKEGQFVGKIRASNDNGKLRIENLSTQDLEVGTPTGVKGEATIEGNSVRADLSRQYNELRDQLDKLADDASFNGINLLRGDKLTITFNETGTSSIDINTKGEEAINSANLKISTWMNEADLDSDSNIDDELDKLKAGLNQVRSQSSAFGSNLSIVQNRQAFTKNMINTLQTGAANLTLADMNEEAANLLALQTRQSLSSSSLSLASQADQSVLQLIR